MVNSAVFSYRCESYFPMSSCLIMNFAFLCSGYFCISRNVLEFYSGTLLGYLEMV